MLSSRKSLERNSRLSVAQAKNRAEENNLNAELNYLEKEKRTALRMLQNEKQVFKLKYSKSSNVYGRSSTDEVLSKYFIPSNDATPSGDSSPEASKIDSEEIHNMLFTNDEIDIEKILCLHLISAHRTESLTPPKRKEAFMCKIHSPLERLLERSKRKHIHLEQKMTSMLPVYTIETLEFGRQNEPKNLINDGRLATRLLLNEIVRELINTVLNALRQTNPEKSFEIFEMANDIGCLKSLFTKKKIINFLDILTNSPLINSCESFILTAPFRVKSIQLELRTLTGNLESLVRQLRQNVLQLPARTQIKIIEETNKKPLFTGKLYRKLSKNRIAEKVKKIQEMDKTPRKSSDLVKHKETNTARKPKRPDIDPENPMNSRTNPLEINDNLNNNSDSPAMMFTKIRKPSSANVKVHLKQTTCPACMVRYKIPLPTPKTPRIKPPPIMPLAPGENPNLKTNTQRRLSMLINKELFQLESYDKRFSSEESIRRRRNTCLLSKVAENSLPFCLNLSPLELAKIELEIKQKETQKKLEKFLKE
ncbi:unnamed protein product [Ceutorhynchus assimilis]|uniref:Uncharacterized protein n=1 Tax=Ceutorhynchus assimilis TaxID=467358 RepID=A0A9N9MQL4_9CUCU|nr:unnamed protein product [Ceutorhynchus assimilis]